MLQFLFLISLLSPVAFGQSHKTENKSAGVAKFDPKSLGAVVSKETLPNRATVRVLFSKDRCQPGKIIFAGPASKDPAKQSVFECPVLGRGTTVYGARPPVKADQISDVYILDPVTKTMKINPVETQWKCGQAPDKKSCCYINPNIQNGATPAPKSGFHFWLDGSRSDTGAYGSNDISCMDFKKQAENPGGRSLLRVHSGREGKDFQNRNTHGCIRIDPACQKFFNTQIESVTGRAPDCSRIPKADKLATLEVIEK